MINRFSIQKTAEYLNISTQTLRRWDELGKLIPLKDNKTGYRYYSKEKIEMFIKNNLFIIGEKWAMNKNANIPFPSMYCGNSADFQSKLNHLLGEMKEVFFPEDMISLITAIIGEIGNNSFDHNLGNWPDIAGIFFGYNLIQKKFILADRGRGLLKTLQRVRPALISNKEALRVAFTEIITGRAPENRGNGLKFVRQIITSNPLVMKFQTGNSYLILSRGDKNLKIKKSLKNIQGCFATIEFLNL